MYVCMYVPWRGRGIHKVDNVVGNYLSLYPKGKRKTGQDGEEKTGRGDISYVDVYVCYIPSLIYRVTLGENAAQGN